MQSQRLTDQINEAITTAVYETFGTEQVTWDCILGIHPQQGLMAQMFFAIPSPLMGQQLFSMTTAPAMAVVPQANEIVGEVIRRLRARRDEVLAEANGKSAPPDGMGDGGGDKGGGIITP